MAGDEPTPPDALRDLAQLAADLGPVLQPRSADEFLQAIVDTARLVLNAAACSIAVLSADEGELEFRVAAGEGAEYAVGTRLPTDRGIAGWALMAGQAVAIDDLSQDPRFAMDIAEQTGYVPHSIMAMPLESEQRSFGVIEVLDPGEEGRHSRADGLEVLALFARQATLALETSAVFADLAKTLFAAAAIAVPSGDLRDALAEHAATAPSAQRELAQLALAFRDLGQLGADERIAAARIVEGFLAYARRHRR